LLRARRWLQFTNVRIPRENMLMKWAQVHPDVRISLCLSHGPPPPPRLRIFPLRVRLNKRLQGTFIPPANPALAYTTLVGERLTMVRPSRWWLVRVHSSVRAR
jgi:hypothetical protein